MRRQIPAFPKKEKGGARRKEPYSGSASRINQPEIWACGMPLGEAALPIKGTLTILNPVD